MLLFSIDEPEEACPNKRSDRAIDGPLRVAGHETAGQNVDALQDPNAARNDKKYCKDFQ